MASDEGSRIKHVPAEQVNAWLKDCSPDSLDKLRAAFSARWEAVHLVCSVSNPLDALNLLKSVRRLDSNALEPCNGATPLAVAAFHCNLPAIKHAKSISRLFEKKFLLNEGARVDAADKHKRTPMHMLALNRNGPEAELVEAAKILLSHGAQLSPLDEKGRTPLMLACANDRPRLAQYLIQEGAYVDQRCYLERRPVHYAASAGSLECLKTLREAHASLEMQDLQGASCLHFALSAERKREQLEPLLDFLLEAIGEAALLSPDRHGTTPLHLAAARAPLPVLQKLLTKHPNIYPKDRKGRGLIHYAAMTDRVDRLRILLDPTTKTPQQNSHTPLHSSARGCAPWATALLCGLPEASSWLDAQEPRHLRTPLHKAAAAGSTQCCEALLERGAKIDCTDKHLQTPLHIAASRGHAEVVQLLLERGASSSAKDSRGNTPLHLSVQFSSVPVAKVLLEASRAEVNSRDEKNRTPMHWAARIGSCEFLELLRSHGAELRVEDSLGRSPLLYAVRYHHREAATWLVQAGASLSNQERSQLRPRDLRYVQMWLKPSDISLENSGSLRTRRHHSRMQYSADKIRAPSETVTSWMEALRDTSTSPSPGTSPRHSAASSPITSPRTSGSPLPPVPQSGKGSKITVPTSARRGHTRSISTPGGFWQGLSPRDAASASSASDPEKWRPAIEAFNEKPAKGIAVLVREGFIREATPQAVAAFISAQAQYLDPQKVGEYLSEQHEFNQQVLDVYVQANFDFTGFDFDLALRMFLARFRLPGEAQKIDRIVKKFARKYYEDNREASYFTSHDQTYMLAFSAIMLNTDAHNSAISKKSKMTREQFLENQTAQGSALRNLPESFLEELYNRIVEHEIRFNSANLPPTSSSSSPTLSASPSSPPTQTAPVPLFAQPGVAIRKGWLQVMLDSRSAKRRYGALIRVGALSLIFVKKKEEDVPVARVTFSRSHSLSRDTSSKRYALHINFSSPATGEPNNCSLLFSSELELNMWYRAIQHHATVK